MVARSRTVLLILATLAATAACRRPSPPAGGPLSLTDDGGATTALSGPARRVVSLTPAATELVFALGAGDRLVGRTRWCDYPAEAAAVPSVGDGLAPNVEAVAATRPDLVLMYRSASNSDATAKLRALGIPVLELALDRQADFERDARLVAAALGRAAVGDSLARATTAAVDAATRVDPHPLAVLIVVWNDPPMTIGAGSFLDEIVRRAGARNLFADVPQPSFIVSLEAVTARNPARVLVVGEGEPSFAARREWQAIPAVRERRFVRVSGSMFNRPSPRMADAITQLARALRGES